MTIASTRSLAASLERALRASASPERAEQERRYLKSSLVHLGASVPAIRKAAVALARAHPDMAREDLLPVVDALWARPIHECRAAAVELLELHVDRLAAADLDVVERLLRESRTWALVDNLAASVAGPLVERFPALGRTLDRWARDEDFWIRRAALLAELIALREGRGDFERFARHAEAMLEEREFFIRKAIGWVLRDLSRRDPERVARWLGPRAGRASGLTLREATKYLDAGVRREILEAAGAASKKAASTEAAAGAAPREGDVTARSARQRQGVHGRGGARRRRQRHRP